MNDLVGDNFLAEKAAAIRSLATSLARDVAEIGRHLSEVKEHFGRGDNPKFLAWASDTLTWSKTTVYRYLEIYEFVRAGNFPNVGKIDLDLSSLYLLAAPSTTDEVRTEIIEQATTGTKKVTHKTVKKTVARAKAKQAAPAPKIVEAKPAPVDDETIPFDEAVREGKLLVAQLRCEAPEEFAEESEHMLVGPDNFMAEHLRDEIAARDERIDELESESRGLLMMVKERDQEIVELKAARAGLEDRVRRMETERADEFADFLWNHVMSESDAHLYMEVTKEHLPGVFEALARHPAARQQEPTQPVEEPAPPTQPVPAGSLTAWGQFWADYRATETPLPLNHPKLIAGMVSWADENGFDVKQLGGAPKEAMEIWTMTAKNFRGHTVAGDLQREYTVKILQRFGDGRRHSIAVMASSLGFKEKPLAMVKIR